VGEKTRGERRLKPSCKLKLAPHGEEAKERKGEVRGREGKKEKKGDMR
jgi:hypothetical protein